MSRQLILHIGYPKTGTTALQSFWHLNAAFLRDNALLYPQAGRVHTAHYGYSYRLGLHDGDTRFDVSELDEMISCLRAEMDQNGVNRALLSSEVFIKAADPETVRTVFEGFDVKILVYLRRHDHLLESGYSQSVRSSPSPPWDSSIGSFILHQLGAGQFSYDYLALLRRWSEVFGKSNMMIRAYQEAREHDLFADSLLALGIASRGKLRMPGRLNSALSYAALCVIDAVHRAGVPQAYRRAIVDRLIVADRAGGTGSRPALLSPNDRAALVARYREVYAAIARDYLGRADGVLFTEPAPQRDPAWRAPTPPDPITVSTMLLKAAAAIAATG
jgi:hypothetical protein